MYNHVLTIAKMQCSNAQSKKHRHFSQTLFKMKIEFIKRTQFYRLESDINPIKKNHNLIYAEQMNRLKHRNAS